MTTIEGVLSDLLDEIRARRPDLAAHAELTSDPARLRDESPVTAVARSLLVFPATDEDVAWLVRLAHLHESPIVPRGARTGLVGGAVPLRPSLVIDLSRLTAIESLDLAGRRLRVGAGVTLGQIDDVLAPHGMMYPPDPASFRRATIGGTVATNAGGLRCVKYGTTDRWIRTLRVVLPDGSMADLGHPVMKDATGYDVRRLFIGSEGTLGIVVSVGLTFCPRPTDARMMLAAFGTIEAALAANHAIRDRLVPSMCELLDRGALASRDTEVLTPLIGRAQEWGSDPALLLLQLDGMGVDAEAATLRAVVAPHAVAVRDVAPADEAEVLAVRRGGSAVRSGRADVEEALVAPADTAPVLPQDLSVPIDRLAQIVKVIREVADHAQLESRIAAHAGDGNLHLLLCAPTDSRADPGEARRRLERAMERIVRHALELGGTVSGEHGIGAAKRGWARQDLGPSVIEMHRAIKRALDPKNLMNPEKAF